MSRIRWYSTLSFWGSLLLSVWLMSRSMDLQWGSELLEWQKSRIVKNYTGALLLALILSQWLLSISRLVLKSKGKEWSVFRELHVAVGTLTVLLAFLHAASFGFGLLGFLSVFFLLNNIISSTYTLNSEGAWNVKFSSSMLLPIHIVFSVTVTFLSLMHWWLVMTFN